MTPSPPAHRYPSLIIASAGALARAGLLLMLLSMLAACGQKGDLYLPDPKPEQARNQQPTPEPVPPSASGEGLEDIDSLSDPMTDPVTDPDADLGLDPVLIPASQI